MDKTPLPIFYDYVFPNFAMANALQVELGMINYLHSMNSNRRHGIGFFEQQLPAGTDTSTVLTYLFDQSFGTWPNSGPGTHLKEGPCMDLVDAQEDSVYFGKRKRQKYIYPIKVTPHLDCFAGVGADGTKIYGNHFWKYMSAEALEDARQGNAIVFLDYAQENFIPRTTYENLHKSIELSGIPREQIVLGFNTFNAEEIYNSWFGNSEQRLVVKSWPFVISNTSYFYNQTRDGRTEPETFYSTRNTIRDNHFLFKIRRPRENRQAIVYAMQQHGLLGLGDWSWLSDVQFNQSYIHYYNTNYGFDLTMEKMEELFSQLPKSLKDEPNDTFSTVSSWTDNQVKSYNNAYFYICTETYTEGPYKSVTEKICKPMGNYMPFVFSSFPGALALLRDMGFKTFHPWIDESYDQEINGHKRVAMIVEEIKKLCSMSKQQLHDWYWSLEDILVHNREHLLEFYKLDKITHDLIQYLYNRVNN